MHHPFPVDRARIRAAWRRIAPAALLMLAPALAPAAIEADALRRIKAATVFVSLGAQRNAGSGSGFLVHRDGGRGLVITNAHVVERAASADLGVVFHSGTRRAEALPARVIGVSRARDLALLEVTSPSLPEPLAVRGASLNETETVHIVGFPFGRGFSTNRETPVVTISRGTVSSQRLDVNDEPRLVQIDGDLNPGNSGGPIVDDAGEVVGVAVATVRQTNIGFAIPLPALVRLLAGTLTDLEGERTPDGVRVRGRLFDPLGAFTGAVLRVRAMSEDRVLDLKDADGAWASIAPGAAGAPFGGRPGAPYEAIHALPEPVPAGASLVAQITVDAGGAQQHLAPFRIEPRALAIALAGPDVAPPAEDAAPGAAAQAGAGDALIDLDELLKRSGLGGQIAAMAATHDTMFDQAPRSDDERTVKERLAETIAARWDEARIRRVYVRSFEAAANADAQRRALELFALPAMTLLHLTPDRLARLGPQDVNALEKARKANPAAFDRRLERMRAIDERRNFSRMLTAGMSTSIGSLSRLLNEVNPPGRRMAPELLQRDVDTTVARIERQIGNAVPLILMHLYRDVSDQDLDDYLVQLDALALRWFAEREVAAFGAVVTGQFSEAEDEILSLFKEVRREALGLADPVDVAGLAPADAYQALIDAHGKETIVGFVLDRRGGEITIDAGRGQSSQFGRPRIDTVSASTLAADAAALELDPPAFTAALDQYLVDQAYRERRLTARAERSRLISALLERRRVRMRNSKDPRVRAALKREEREERAQCRQACSAEQARCDARVRQLADFCRQSLPKERRARHDARAQCAEKENAQRSSCYADRQQCRSAC